MLTQPSSVGSRMCRLFQHCMFIEPRSGGDFAGQVRFIEGVEWADLDQRLVMHFGSGRGQEAPGDGVKRTSRCLWGIIPAGVLDRVEFAGAVCLDN